jgi:flagellar hook-length control protein FliK
MNISLLKAISAGNVGTKPTAILKPVKASPARRAAAVPAGNVPLIRTGENAATDNSRLIAQKKPIAGPSKNFSRVLVKKMKTKMSPNTQPEILQGILTAPVALDKAAGTKVLNRLQQQPQSLLKSEINSPAAPQSLLITNVQPESGENVGKMRISDKAFVAGGKLLNQKNIKEPASETLPLADKMTITTEKPIITDQPVSTLEHETTVPTKPVITSTPFPSRKNQQSSKQSNPETLISDDKTDPDNEHSVVINKLPVSDNPKTQLSKTPVVDLSDQSSRPGRKVLIGSESPKQVLEETTTSKVVSQTTPIKAVEETTTSKVVSQTTPIKAVEETTTSKADANQKDHRGTTQPFELPEKNKAQIGNLPTKSITQKTNPQLAQVSASQAENHNNSSANQQSNPDIDPGEYILAGNSDHLGITKQSSSSPAEPFVNIAGKADSDTGVGEQIQESIHNSFRTGSQQILIRLNPPELGRVAIKFTEQSDEIIGLLQVDKPQTRDQIQQALPEIIQNLQSSGITIKKIEVVLTNQQEQQTFKDQSSTPGQDTFSGQQSAPNPQSQRDNAMYNEWMTNNESGTQFNETQAYVTDKSVNMLV